MNHNHAKDVFWICLGLGLVLFGLGAGVFLGWRSQVDSAKESTEPFRVIHVNSSDAVGMSNALFLCRPGDHVMVGPGVWVERSSNSVTYSNRLNHSQFKIEALDNGIPDLPIERHPPIPPLPAGTVLGRDPGELRTPHEVPYPPGWFFDVEKWEWRPDPNGSNSQPWQMRHKP